MFAVISTSHECGSLVEAPPHRRRIIYLAWSFATVFCWRCQPIRVNVFISDEIAPLYEIFRIFFRWSCMTSNRPKNIWWQCGGMYIVYVHVLVCNKCSFHRNNWALDDSIQLNATYTFFWISHFDTISVWTMSVSGFEIDFIVDVWISKTVLFIRFSSEFRSQRNW